MDNSFILEKKDRNSFSGSTGGDNFLQSFFWADLKQCFGWHPVYYMLDGSPFLVMLRKLSPFYWFAYIPYAPDENYRSLLPELSFKLKSTLPSGTVFIRYDLAWQAEKSPLPPAVKSSADIQPPVTVIIDLSPDTETILASMKSKTRYNIRLSAKKGVTVRRYGIEMLDTWYSLYLETGKRDRIALHSYNYYRKVFEYGSGEGSGAEIRLYMAESESKQIAGIVTCFYRGKATYLYGASSNEGREKMPAYALQWKAICDAREYGCTEYDMFGIPPSDDPSHPMHWLYRFKTGFGGAITARAGCFDFPLRRGSYLFFRLAENARNYYYKKLKKRG